MSRSRAIFGLTLLVIALAVVLAALQPKHPGPLPRGFRGATLAIEMVRSWPELTIVLAMEPAEKQKLKQQTQVDFVYAAAYAGLFALVAFEVWRGRMRYVAAAVAVAAGVCDWRENLGILAVLERDKGFSDEMALAISDPAQWKWGLLAGLWLVMGGVWLWRAGWRAPGPGYAAAGLWGLAAMWDEPKLELVFAPLALALIVQLAYYWPSRARTSAVMRSTISDSVES